MDNDQPFPSEHAFIKTQIWEQDVEGIQSVDCCYKVRIYLLKGGFDVNETSYLLHTRAFYCVLKKTILYVYEVGSLQRLRHVIWIILGL